MPGARYGVRRGRCATSLYRPAEAAQPGPGAQARAGRAASRSAAPLAALFAIPFLLLLLLVESSWQPLERLDVDVADSLNSVRPTARAWLVHSLDVGLGRARPVGRSGSSCSPSRSGCGVRGAQRLAIWAVVTMAIGGVLGVRPQAAGRPGPARHFPEPVAHASGYSFPSGHALNSMLGVAVLILVFLPVLTRTGRVVAYAVGALLVLLTGFDRVALGVHFVSDVVAGWVVALAVLGRHRGGVRDLAPRAGPAPRRRPRRGRGARGRPGDVRRPERRHDGHADRDPSVRPDSRPALLPITKVGPCP